jgi:hypothetical protein
LTAAAVLSFMVVLSFMARFSNAALLIPPTVVDTVLWN